MFHLKNIVKIKYGILNVTIFRSFFTSHMRISLFYFLSKNQTKLELLFEYVNI